MNHYQNTPFDLTGRIALVTGSGRGLGKEMARIFAQAGADVMLCSRTEAQLRDTARELAAETGRRIEFAVADTSRRPEAARLAEAALQRMGRIDILVSNAGHNIPRPVDQVRDEDWDYLFEINVHSSMALTRALCPGMMERRWGRIIYTSSILGLGSTPDRPAYSASKAALHGMVKANALRLGAFGITVNCLALGPFATDMSMTILTEAQKAAFADRCAMKRWGQPRELAPAALLMASEAGAFITGSVMVVDGGATARLF